MLEESRTKKGSFTAAQSKIMLGLYGKGWVKKLLASEEFCPAIWEKFKSLNITHEALYAEKRKSNAVDREGNLNALDTGKFNECRRKKEKGKDDVSNLLTSGESFKRLRNDAGNYCVDIYKDFSKEEIKAFSPSIQKAWETGRKIEENLNLFDKPSNDN